MTDKYNFKSVEDIDNIFENIIKTAHKECAGYSDWPTITNLVSELQILQYKIKQCYINKNNAEENLLNSVLSDFNQKYFQEYNWKYVWYVAVKNGYTCDFSQILKIYNKVKELNIKNTTKKFEKPKFQVGKIHNSIYGWVFQNKDEEYPFLNSWNADSSPMDKLDDLAFCNFSNMLAGYDYNR